MKHLTDYKKIGLALRELRKNKDYTQEYSADKCGRSKQWLCDVEHGRKRLYFEDVKTLCKLYDSSMDNLLELAKRL